MIVAICDAVADSIYATGTTEEEAKTNLWALVHEYLVDRRAGHTSSMSAAELEEYFGSVVLNIGNKPKGFVR